MRSTTATSAPAGRCCGSTRASARAGPVVDPAVRRRPRDDALGGRLRRRGRGGRDRHQHGLPGAEGPQDRRRRRAAGRPGPSGGRGARDGRRGSAGGRGARPGDPVTVKLRSGLRSGESSGFELAHRLVGEAGVAAIGFHPRSAAVHHKGQPDYELAARLVQTLPAPVILTGGLDDPQSITEALDRTGAAAVMLARGALGNPWLFSQLLGRAQGEPTPEEVRRELDWTIERAVEHLGRATRHALSAEVLSVVPAAAGTGARGGQAPAGGAAESRDAERRPGAAGAGSAPAGGRRLSLTRGGAPPRYTAALSRADGPSHPRSQRGFACRAEGRNSRSRVPCRRT